MHEPDTAVSDLRDLDRSAVLDVVVSARRSADREEARLLAAAVQWVDLHPVTEQHPAAVFRDGTRRGPLGHGLAFDDEVPLAGVGTPGVAEYAVEELAAALDLSFAAGLHAGQRGGRAVLPAARGCGRWSRTAGCRPGRPARSPAPPPPCRATSVAFVDRHLAVTGRHNRIPALNPVLHEARLRCDPDQAAAVEQLALEHRGVWFDHRESTAVTTMTARLDTLDALDLDGSARRPRLDHRPARRPPAPGPAPGHRPRDARPPATRAALGARRHRRGAPAGDRPRHTGARTGRAGPSTCTWTRPTSRTRRPVAGRWRSSAPPPWSCSGTGSSGSPGSPCRPVLDLARTDAVDGHDAPVWMRELVMLRDGHCVFPGCTTDARACDLDHLAAVRPPRRGRTSRPDHTGEPGLPVPATPPDEDLRRLGLPTRPRRPARTTTGTTYEWTSPLHRTYRVTPRPR